MLGESKKSVVLTGATGFLGAFLLAGLLDQGYQVTALGRSSAQIRLADRLSGLVRWLDLNPRQRLLPVEGDFTKKHFGLDDKTYSQLCADTDIIIHCASDTSFAERNRKRILETNINNLSSLLEFAEDSQAKRFYYISTAYAVGVREGICLEEPAEVNHKFTNVYEESKARAEEIISNGCKKIGIPLSILRPSIVYGHSKTGRALKFNALYYAVKSISYIKDIFVKDIVEHGGERSKKWGFNLNNDGTLNIPLTVYLPEDGAVNLISVDHFVDTTLSIIENDDDGIYNITCDNPPNILTISDYIESFLGIRGIKVIYKPSEKQLNPAEELFARFFEPYRPYLSDRREFDRSHTISVVNGLSTPPLTYDIFNRCMSYAVACDWGKISSFPK